MGRDRFVTSETVKLDLTDGDWIIVKKRLTYGEQQRYATAGFRTVIADKKRGDDEAEISVDFERTAIMRLAVWISEWSFTRNGKSVPVTQAAISALDADTVAEIDAALTVHIEAMDAEKKATSDGEPSP